MRLTCTRLVLMTNTLVCCITSRPAHAVYEHFPRQFISETDNDHRNGIGSIPNNQYILMRLLTVVSQPVEAPAARQGWRLFIWIQAQIRNAASFSVAYNGLLVTGKALLAYLGCETNKLVSIRDHTCHLA